MRYRPPGRASRIGEYGSHFVVAYVDDSSRRGFAQNSVDRVGQAARARRILHLRRIDGLRQDNAERLVTFEVAGVAQDRRHTSVGLVVALQQNVEQFGTMVAGDIGQ